MEVVLKWGTYVILRSRLEDRRRLRTGRARIDLRLPSAILGRLAEIA